jgi:hypothetical protein
MDPFGNPVTPYIDLSGLRSACRRLNFRINYEIDAGAIARHMSRLAENLHYALTDKFPEFSDEERTVRSTVVTDHIYRVDDAMGEQITKGV